MKKISVFRAIFTILATALFAAVFLLYFSADQNFRFLSAEPEQTLPEILPTLLPNDQNRIGIVAGHWGFDSGHTCAAELHSLREVDVNLRIATYLRDILTQRGYQVDLLREFDPALAGYVGIALIAIHNDSCDYINSNATGYKISSLGEVAYPTEAKNLLGCLNDRFSRVTGQPYSGNVISSDADIFYDYAAIDPYTTAAIIEPGFMNLDYRFLTEKTELIARAIADGLVCYVRGESTGKKAGQVYIQNDLPKHFFDAAPKENGKFILPGIPGITD